MAELKYALLHPFVEFVKDNEWETSDLHTTLEKKENEGGDLEFLMRRCRAWHLRHRQGRR